MSDPLADLGMPTDVIEDGAEPFEPTINEPAEPLFDAAFVQDALQAPAETLEEEPRKVGKLERRIRSALDDVGDMLALGTPSMQADGYFVKMGSERFAFALNSLCEENVAVKKWVEKMLRGGAWGQVFAASLGIVVPIMLNHGMLPGMMQRFAPGVPETNNGQVAEAVA